MAKTIITICSSVSFYKRVVEIQEQLQAMGYEVLIPYTAEKMKEANNFELAGFKPTLEEFERKATLMQGHFDKVDQGDVCLVVNNEKHGVPNYIGGNVLMEMGLAFHQSKPIVLLNDVPPESIFLEEILGMKPILLHGKIEDLPAKLAERN